MRTAIIACFLSSYLFFPAQILAETSSTPSVINGADARSRVRSAINYWRGDSSITEASMLVHREDWQRTSSLKTWTKGTDLTLVRFTAPKKDSGNASLTVNEEIWTFSPKTNRVIKIPASMKSQSWMGSDFSYQDLSKDDEIIDAYDHTLLAEEEHQGKKVYVIQSIPHETAPIVWGKEILKIREDNIIVEHSFFDQEMRLVKKLTATKIAPLGGRMYPVVIRMENVEEVGQWTEIEHSKAVFGAEVSDNFFSVSSLQNRRR